MNIIISSITEFYQLQIKRAKIYNKAAIVQKLNKVNAQRNSSLEKEYQIIETFKHKKKLIRRFT